ncbi:FMN-binding negative transcriptional regulator [Massilia sp. TS11]|uniref:FMN-binding negative transcriptional regulator n=1 Tax=Massilia sp. TS11 TaxID=2908003 RepID=UPI001ED9E6E7|nr:FMN-binding negative transcriptional regulator [Massilia sp. TS11]MCG2585016.1 FMN-binding negative transcriptional regulator [Massilia sp. TS11]
MYTPSAFSLDSLAGQHALMAAHPLGALVTHTAAGLDAEHLPFCLIDPTPEAPLGTLRAHVARANPVWRQAEAAAMVVFSGASAYVSPSWYEGKASHHREVPTYNYAVVHAHGRLRAIEDPQWLLALLERLTARHEAGRAAPWSVHDAPRDYIDKLLQAIVGIEIVITRIDGKCKASQNRSASDQARVAAALASEAPAMSALMRKTG